MARIRYVGPAAAKDVPLSGGFVHFERMKWVDPFAAADAAHIRREHVEIAVRDLITQDDWESEPHQKAAKTRAKQAAEANEPAEPDEEQS